MRISKELVKGSTALLVLSLIAGGEMYGYQVIRELEARSNDVFHLNEGTLYPILHALELEACLTARWEESDSGRKRKYYAITDKGRRELARQQREWQEYAVAVASVTGGVRIVPA